MKRNSATDIILYKFYPWCYNFVGLGARDSNNAMDYSEYNADKSSIDGHVALNDHHIPLSPILPTSSSSFASAINPAVKIVRISPKKVL